MKVRFLARSHIHGTTYAAGSEADIDPEVGYELIGKGAAMYLGDGDRHLPTWDDLATSASAINPAGAINAPSMDTTETGYPGTLLFSGSADNLLAGQIQIAHTWSEGSAMDPHIHWMLTADSAAAVGWELYYRVSPRGAVSSSWIGPLSGTTVVSHGNVADVHAITSFGSIGMAGYQVSDIISWRLYRRGTTDANNADARLLSIDFHYQKDASGSIYEFTKQ